MQFVQKGRQRLKNDLDRIADGIFCHQVYYFDTKIKKLCKGFDYDKSLYVNSLALIAYYSNLGIFTSLA